MDYRLITLIAKKVKRWSIEQNTDIRAISCQAGSSLRKSRFIVRLAPRLSMVVLGVGHNA